MTRACRHDRLIQLRVRPSLAQHQVHPRGQLPGHRHLEKAVFSIHCDFSDVGSSTVYISLENLNRITSWYVMTYCKPCLHSAPENCENRVKPTNKTLAQQQDGRRSGRFFHYRTEPLLA